MTSEHWKVLALSTVLGLSACDNDDAIRDLTDAIAVSDQNVVSLSLSSDQNKLIFEPGESWQLIATGNQPGGGTVDYSSTVRWGISPALGSIDRNGVLSVDANVTGQQAVTITAGFAQFNETLAVTFSDATLQSLAVSAATDPVDECQRTTLSADGFYSDSSTRPVADAVFSIDNPALGAISGAELIARVAGIPGITGSKSGVTSAALPVTISDTQSDLSINEGAALSVKLGNSAQLTASADYSSGPTGVDVSANVAWSSASSAVASIDNNGLLTTNTLGTAIITASCGGFSRNTVISVLNAVDVNIVVPDPNPQVPGEVLQLQLYEVLSDSTEDRSTDLAANDNTLWTISTGSEVARIDANGEITFADSFAGFNGNFITVEVTYANNFSDTQNITIDN